MPYNGLPLFQYQGKASFHVTAMYHTFEMESVYSA